jgi:peptidoglycan/LPS O-acetylase OafA/YrhL
MFFVLSGFLLTQILLTEKKQSELLVNNTQKLSIIGKFIARRSLKIFPLYYLLLIILIKGRSFHFNSLNKDWPYYFSYTQNFLLYFNQEWSSSKLSPLYTLAVEEQFYLFWPWIIIFSPKKYLVHLLSGGVIIGVLTQLYIFFFMGNNIFAYLLTPSCIDTFCIGGLLAYIVVYQNALNKYYNHLKIIGIIGLIIFIIGNVLKINTLIPQRTLVSLISVWLIAKILTNKNEYFNSIMTNKFVMSLGKVSYGLYLFHNFVPINIERLIELLKKYPNKIPFSNELVNISTNQGAFLIICTLALLIITYISFNLIEKPILKFKKYFA